jgi:hypothetical protein
LAASEFGSTLSGEIWVPAAKYEGKTLRTELGEERSREGSKLCFVDPIVLAGVIVILGLCNCSKLFTSY